MADETARTESASTGLSRRQVLAAAGIVLWFSLEHHGWTAQGSRLPGSLATNRRLDAWIRIEPSGSATVFTGKVELGQGILTALAQIAAEELELPLARITLISGDTARTPNEGVTSGSFSIENGGAALRYAGAEVRGLLLQLAAARWGVAVSTLEANDGAITAADGRRMGYGELAGSLNLQRDATAATPPKSPQSYRVVGQPVPRLDIPAKVSGGAIYVQDLRLPGMLHGRIVRPPRPGARLLRDPAPAMHGKPGLLAVVRDGGFLGLVAEHEFQAVKLRVQLAAVARWDEAPPLPASASVHALLRTLPAQQAIISDRPGELPAGASILEASYRRDYLAHASIGPSCAVALHEDRRLTVWTHSQGVFPLRASLAQVFQLPPDAVHCIHQQGSGCYGHNGADDVALDAALLARAVPGRPVRLQWMRDDEFTREPYGPAMSMEARGAVLGGRIVDWQYEVWSNTHGTRPVEEGGVNLLTAWNLERPLTPSPNRLGGNPPGAGDRNAIPLYDFPRQRVVHHLVEVSPLRTSALRTLGAHANIWASESFMDELALVAQMDPVSFRLTHLRDPRARAVIEAVAGAAGWPLIDAASPETAARGAASPPNGERRGRGIGFARYKNEATYVAVIAEVAVDMATGEVRVSEAHLAADAGLVINPDGLINQLEGGAIQATSWTLKESVQFDPRGIVSRDWATYPILSMSEVPTVRVQLLQRPDQPALGAGEAACGPMAAAIANAFTQATGVRARELPMTPQRVRALLA
jgi:CO/xanthine dehydrogenase Mo-binding subunit